MSEPGRVCPLRYRYGAKAIAVAPQREVSALYVIGGLYGNLPALDRVEAMAGEDTANPTLCFNGDFNWFNVETRRFLEVNRRVLANDALQGNVEAELHAPAGDAGCGCAYPDSVDAGTVERSNRIHARLKIEAERHPELQQRLAQLPMFRRYRIGDSQIGVVHGDAEALAGWRFDVDALDDERNRAWLRSVFDSAQADIFASTHTCLPAMRCIDRGRSTIGVIANNGAAGMPNFRGELYGLLTRIAITPSPHEVLHEVRTGEVHVALLPVRYEHPRWLAEFSMQWPDGSPAWRSYFSRITQGPDFSPARAIAYAS